MIPADLASRLRVLIDSEVKAPAPIQELLADFPELATGQRFSATIQSALPDGTFRALVAGRNLTLAMPEGAKSGDVLELVVTGRQDKAITARLADLGSAATSVAQPRLSPAGQLISQLLTGRHGDTQPAALNRNEPLLSAPPTKGASLTPLLRQAVSESGLFYESHQAQWADGEGSLESLLRQPQARLGIAIAQTLAGNSALATGAPSALPGSLSASPESPSDSPDAATDSGTHPSAPNSAGLPTHGQNASAANDPNAAARNAMLRSGQETDGQREAAADKSQTSHSALKIAEQLMPLVHQQLEALATHQALWQGQVWPGQTMQWQILDPEGQSHSSGDQGDGSEAPPWQSTLRLKMPRLGDIEAQLIVTAAGVAVRVSADSTRAVEQLREGGEALGSALEAAGVPMTGFVVQSGGARETRL